MMSVDMAIGLSNHLKIRDTPQHERTVSDIATIRTFWSLFFFDRFVHHRCSAHENFSRSLLLTQ